MLNTDGPALEESNTALQSRTRSADVAARVGSPILEVRDLKTYFFTKRGVGRAVDGVTFDLRRGEALGLVGESGSGKSITCLSLLRLNPSPASKIVGGAILFRGIDILKMSEANLREIRGLHIGLILQDPSTALNPVYTIGEQLFESLRLHRKLRGAGLKDAALGLLTRVRISAGRARLGSYPHQLSGGMQQRVVGAIAVSAGPQILIADEPTTSLDVTTQASYLGMLKKMQRDTGLSMLFVTHDLGLVAGLCDRVAIMYAGNLVELGPTRRLFEAPAHPYTQALLRSRPDVTQRPRRLEAIGGQPPSIYARQGGCPFAPRCVYVMKKCWNESPPERAISTDHSVRCWKYVS